MAKVRLERESVARDVPGYWRHRKEVAHTLERRLKGKKTGGQQAKPRTPTQGTRNHHKEESQLLFLVSNPKVFLFVCRRVYQGEY